MSRESKNEDAFEPDGAEVKVRRVEADPAHRADAVRALRGIWAETPGGRTDELLDERRREREREERRIREVGD